MERVFVLGEVREWGVVWRVPGTAQVPTGGSVAMQAITSQQMRRQVCQRLMRTECGLICLDCRNNGHVAQMILDFETRGVFSIPKQKLGCPTWDEFALD